MSLNTTIQILRGRLSQIGTRKMSAVDFAIICNAPRGDILVALGLLVATGEAVLLDDGYFTAAPIIPAEARRCHG